METHRDSDGDERDNYSETRRERQSEREPQRELKYDRPRRVRQRNQEIGREKEGQRRPDKADGGGRVPSVLKQLHRISRGSSCTVHTLNRPTLDMINLFQPRSDPTL